MEKLKREKQVSCTARGHSRHSFARRGAARSAREADEGIDRARARDESRDIVTAPRRAASRRYRVSRRRPVVDSLNFDAILASETVLLFRDAGGFMTFQDAEISIIALFVASTPANE